MKENIGWLFYKDYYSGRNLDNINYKQKSKNITDKKLSDYAIPYLPEIEKKKNFQLQTIYPGLLIGSGYQHDFSHNDAFKIGFYFDYTTGLPLIPGSSVKGVLRSAFEKANGGYVKEILKEILNLSDDIIKKLMDEKVQTENVKGKIPLLEAHIFHGVHQVKEKYKDKEGKEQERIVIKNLSPYQTDIFFDAFPIDTNNKNGKFLANDYITPHKDPLKNPVPLQFLKILPQVTFQFNFRLHDFKDEKGNDLLFAENKKELFKQILLDLGIGAKTNVGYGQFTDEIQKSNSTNSASTIQVHKQQRRNEQNQHFTETIPNDQKVRNLLKRNAIFNGVVTSIEKDYCYISFDVNGKTCKIRKKYNVIRKDGKKITDIEILHKDMKVVVTVKNDYRYGENLNCQVKIS